jgi:protease I
MRSAPEIRARRPAWLQTHTPGGTNMANKRVLVLVGDYSEDYEVKCGYVTLTAHGYDVALASPNKRAGDSIRTSIHEFEFDDEHNYSEKPGHRVKLNTTLAEIDENDFIGLFAPGGRGAEYIRHHDRVIEIVHHFANSGKPMASVCNGLQVYTEAGVVDGKVCIGYPDHRTDAIRAGAKWPDVEIVRGETVDQAFVDGNLVSGATFACLPSVLRSFMALLDQA